MVKGYGICYLFFVIVFFFGLRILENNYLELEVDMKVRVVLIVIRVKRLGRIFEWEELIFG